MTLRERLAVFICDVCVWVMCLVTGAKRGSDVPDLSLTFETRDAGRTWTLAGRPLECSPLTDRLQDAWTNHEAGWPVETEGGRRRFLVAHGFRPEVTR